MLCCAQVSLRRCDELIDKLKAFSGAALTSAVEASYENMDERFFERLAHRQKEGDLDIAPLAQEIQHTMQVMRLDFALLYKSASAYVTEVVDSATLQHSRTRRVGRRSRHCENEVES